MVRHSENSSGSELTMLPVRKWPNKACAISGGREARVCCQETELVNTYDGLVRDAWTKRGLLKQYN